MARALALAALLAFAARAGAGAAPTFDWGDPTSCAAGSGSFTYAVPHLQTKDIGVIPAGKTGVKVYLKASTDADVQLIEKSGGHQLVAYPAGVLNKAYEQCHNTGSMRVCYSGYNGPVEADGWQYDDTKGHEWITIEGTTDRELVMRAYGYAAANATVSYSWEKDAVCCSGGGSGAFVQEVHANATETLGSIPAGIQEVVVRLHSANDVDVQLTDTETGTVVVGWPAGLLKGKDEECATYRGNRYCYSGYNGEGWEGTEGNEWINVTGGATATPLRMTVFGYKAGKADVKYSSSRPSECDAGASAGGSGADGALLADGRTVSFDFDAHAKVHGDDGASWARTFNRPAAAANATAPATEARVVVRRGGSVYVRVTGKSLVEHIGAATFKMANHTFAKAGSYWAGAPKKSADGLSAVVELGTPVDAALGLFKLRVSVPGFAPKEHVAGAVAVLFNPWHPHDGVFLDGDALRKEYLQRVDGRVWYGSVSMGGDMSVWSMAWNYHQYEVLESVLHFLGRVEGAPGFRHEAWWNDPARVSREITRQTPLKLLRGRWSGDYTGGRAPTYWTNSREIMSVAASSGGPAKYGQCWVFASLTRTLATSVGVPSRVVTNFQSAHDTDHPADFVANMASHDSVWNFHVWNDVWIRRGAVPQWNAIDSTPQELSDGHYQCGPAPLEAVRSTPAAAHAAPWDADFVRAEVNSLWWSGDSSTPYSPAAAAARPCADWTTGCSHRVVGQHTSTTAPGCRADGNACRQDVTAEYKPGWTPQQPAAAAALLEVADEQMGGLAASLSSTTPDLGDNVTLAVTLPAASRAAGGTLRVRAFVVYEDGTVANLPSGDAPCGAAPRPSACSCGHQEMTPDFCAAAAARQREQEQHCCCNSTTRPAQPDDVRPSLVSVSSRAGPAPPAQQKGDGVTSDQVEHGTSVPGESLAELTQEVPAGSNATTFELAVTAQMYAKYMWKTSTVRFVARFDAANVTSKHTVTRQVTFRPPALTVVPSCHQPEAGRKFFLTLSFVNKLPIDLTGLEVSTDGPTPSSDQVVKYPGGGVVRPGQRAVLRTRDMVMNEAGTHTVVASLESCQYHDLFGSAVVVVPPSAKRLTDPERVCSDRVQ